MDEKSKIPEMTPEQKVIMETVRDSVSKFNKMVSFYLFNQLSMIEDGEIHIHLMVKKHCLDNIELHSRLARNFNNGEED